MKNNVSDFHAFGSFGRILDLHKQSHTTRSVAEIFLGDADRTGNPNAIFVMTNPGSCERLTNTLNRPLPKFCNARATIDPTQKVIAALMKAVAWKHVRIINLSDLKQGSGKKFEKTLAEFEFIPEHSIFHDSRNTEREELLDVPDGTPIVFAWKADPDRRLRTIASIAISKLPENATGRKHPKNRFGYYHPKGQRSSDREAWFEWALNEFRK